MDTETTVVVIVWPGPTGVTEQVATVDTTVETEPLKVSVDVPEAIVLVEPAAVETDV